MYVRAALVRRYKQNFRTRADSNGQRNGDRAIRRNKNNNRERESGANSDDGLRVLVAARTSKMGPLQYAQRGEKR